jgi:hypothetical protein
MYESDNEDFSLLNSNLPRGERSIDRMEIGFEVLSMQGLDGIDAEAGFFELSPGV